MSRDIDVSSITDTVKKLCMEAHHTLEPDMRRAFGRALGTERSPAGRQALQTLQGNTQLARTIVIDARDGGDLYQDGMAQYARE